MNTKQHNQQKILNEETLMSTIARLRAFGKKIVFTNGCFDLLHTGHIHTLQEAAALGDFLFVAVNSDASVSRLKGPTRPLNHEQNRAQILAALSMVDGVMIFEEDTPLQLIKKIQPDVLVKGGDYRPDEIVGAKEVIAGGGEIAIMPFIENISTTQLIKKVIG
ncbi:MAG: D-glycero-beta-D-manno-heptose 1-phosphate adenylyltransferase [Chitinophagaceae bacterium]